jgi:hypothetical protein
MVPDSNYPKVRASEFLQPIGNTVFFLWPSPFGSHNSNISSGAYVLPYGPEANWAKPLICFFAPLMLRPYHIKASGRSQSNLFEILQYLLFAPDSTINAF